MDDKFIEDSGDNDDATQQLPLIGDNNRILPETEPVTGFQPDGGRSSLRKPVLLLVAIAMVVGVFAATILWLYSQNDTINTASETRPIEFVTPSASPEPTQAPSSKAPEAPVKVEPSTEAPVKTAVPSSKPTSKPAPAKCKVYEIYSYSASDKYLGKETVKALIEQNMAWNEVYGGEFHFPSQEIQFQDMDMNEMFNWMNGHGPQRSGLDFLMLYNYNADTITERLKAVNGPCEELADLDRAWIEGIPDLFERPKAASTHPDHSDFLVMLNKLAEKWLNDRNELLTGQAS